MVRTLQDFFNLVAIFTENTKNHLCVFENNFCIVSFAQNISDILNHVHKTEPEN